MRIFPKIRFVTWKKMKSKVLPKVLKELGGIPCASFDFETFELLVVYERRKFFGYLEAFLHELVHYFLFVIGFRKNKVHNLFDKEGRRFLLKLGKILGVKFIRRIKG